MFFFLQNKLSKTKHAGDRSFRGIVSIYVLAATLVVAICVCFTIGTSNASLAKLIEQAHYLNFPQLKKTSDYIIIVEVRLPRVILGALIGSSLAVSGVLMQGLFRNPLADPGIMGVSAGASLGATAFIVIGKFIPYHALDALGDYGIFVCSFFGGLLVSSILYTVGTKNGRTSVATLLLAGLAIAALAGAIVGFLVFMASDSQLRDITFWNLGSLAGINWMRVMSAGPIVLLCLMVCPFLAAGLNGLVLGETVAAHLGFNVQKIKFSSIVLVALMCGASVSASGGISFIGIIVPHLLRLLIGPDHRYLIPSSAFLGGAFLIIADCFSRTIAAPAELPIGIITAAIGAPFFLWILLSNRGRLDL